MACGMQTQSARRAVGLATTATLELFEEIRSYREAALEPRRCLEQTRPLGFPPLAGEMSEGQRGGRELVGAGL